MGARFHLDISGALRTVPITSLRWFPAFINSSNVLLVWMFFWYCRAAYCNRCRTGC
jgi:hypothetical protein